ncbi:MAG: T9SS type A sorting domain-containing protein [Bacteroidota bacterium]
MRNLLVILFLTSMLSSQAQDPEIEWQNTIGGSLNDNLRTIIHTSDGGYLLGGPSSSDISGDKTENSIGSNDYWVVKVDAFGVINWQNTIGGSLGDNLIEMVETDDGDYILGGQSNSDISGDKTENSQGMSDYWVVKIDSSGDIIWQNTIGGSASEEFTTISLTNDGGCIIGGHSLSGISGDKTEPSIGFSDFWILKLGPLGNIQWQNTIGGNLSDQLEAIVQTQDGGYIIGGKSESGISGDKTEAAVGDWDYWVLKLNATGDIEWQNTIGGDLHDDLHDIYPTMDGGYILAGDSRSNAFGDKTENSLGSKDYWVVKIDDTGTIEWDNTIGGDGQEELFSVFQISDGSYFIGGGSTSGISVDKDEPSINGSFDYWVLQLDSNGDIIWQNTIGGAGSDFLWQIRPTNDGGIVLAGESWSDISGDKNENSNGGSDFWVVKLDLDLPLASAENSLNSVAFYPNPVTHYLMIKDSHNLIEEIKVYSVHGVLVHETAGLDYSSTGIDVSNLKSGVYFLRVSSDGNLTTLKFIKNCIWLYLI